MSRRSVFPGYKGIARAAALSSIVPALAGASAPPRSVDPTIVVTGRSPTPAPAQAAAEFVRRTGLVQGERQAARWVDPVCPRVAGLPADLAARVEARLRAAAVDAHVPLAAGPCRANVVVAFTDDGAALTRAIAARAPGFAALAPSRRAALANGAVPVRWWYATSAEGADGRAVVADAPPATFGHNMDGGGGSDLPQGVPALSTYTSSIVETSSVRVLKAATVVVDVDRASGRTLDAVADYAAFVALAEIHPGDSPPMRSILSLFSAAEPPAHLTAQDAALLASLYRLPLARVAALQRGALLRGVAAAFRPAEE